MHATFDQLPKAPIGIDGLDDILCGGLARSRLHLLEGTPGTGKTTVALQFLPPLHDFQGILRGIPTYLGKAVAPKPKP